MIDLSSLIPIASKLLAAKSTWIAVGVIAATSGAGYVGVKFYQLDSELNKQITKYAELELEKLNIESVNDLLAFQRDALVFDLENANRRITQANEALEKERQIAAEKQNSLVQINKNLNKRINNLQDEADRQTPFANCLSTCVSDEFALLRTGSKAVCP